MTALVLMFAVFADLASVRQEPNLERRSERALENAAGALDAAREAYHAGDLPKTKASLEEIRESVDLAYTSLQETHKQPRRSPKYFKRAELKTRELLRRLAGLSELMSYEDRDMVDTVRQRVQLVHDELLQGIMSKKK